MTDIKFYIASRLENAEQVRQLADRLKWHGLLHTYDWTEHGSVQREHGQRIKEVCAQEARGVADADIVVVILPGGRGTHTELGMAIAMGKQVVLCAANPSFITEETCVFYWSNNVSHCISDGIQDWVYLTLQKAEALQTARTQQSPANSGAHSRGATVQLPCNIGDIIYFVARLECQECDRTFICPGADTGRGFSLPVDHSLCPYEIIRARVYNIEYDTNYGGTPLYRINSCYTFDDPAKIKFTHEDAARELPRQCLPKSRSHTCPGCSWYDETGEHCLY